MAEVLRPRGRAQPSGRAARLALHTDDRPCAQSAGCMPLICVFQCVVGPRSHLYQPPASCRALADAALPAYVAGEGEGCTVSSSKETCAFGDCWSLPPQSLRVVEDLGIAWVRHAETRLLFEGSMPWQLTACLPCAALWNRVLGDASLLLLSTCVKPIRKAGVSDKTEPPLVFLSAT